ncbi:MAG: CBS domain-containing protein [Deltaproteobacteria bacterium]|nr:CBS domain-containing protein [Deltaproteobacteria bacterium]
MKNLTARDVMNPDVLTIGPDWSIDQLADFFIRNSISGAPVTSSDAKLIGVVSMTDIVKHRTLPQSEAESDGPHEYFIYSHELPYSQADIESVHIESESLVTVREIMTPMTFEVREDTDIRQVADDMIRGRIHRVFVSRDGKLVGIITTMDMLKAIRDC